MKTATATTTARPVLRWVSVPDASGGSHLEMLWVTSANRLTDDVTTQDVPVAA